MATASEVDNTNWEDYRNWSSYNYARSCPGTQCWPFYGYSAFEANRKVKKLDKWMPHTAATTAKSLQSCPILCDPIPGILQARTLEWVAISFSNAWKVKSESEVAQSCLTLCDPMDCSLLCPWDFPGKSTGVGCHCLLRMPHKLTQIKKIIILKCHLLLFYTKTTNCFSDCEM